MTRQVSCRVKPITAGGAKEGVGDKKNKQRYSHDNMSRLEARPKKRSYLSSHGRPEAAHWTEDGKCVSAQKSVKSFFILRSDYLMRLL